jgi:hypothetical protein
MTAIPKCTLDSATRARASAIRSPRVVGNTTSSRRLVLSAQKGPPRAGGGHGVTQRQVPFG